MSARKTVEPGATVPAQEPAPVLVYATFPDTDGAIAAARALLDEHLIACANVLPGTTSIYRWQGRVETASEVVLICKSVSDRAERLVEALRLVHPYDLPAILVLPVTGGSAPFLEWIAGATRPAEQTP